MLINLRLISNRLSFLNQEFLRCIAYEKILGDEIIKKIALREEENIDTEFFEKCNDENIEETKLVMLIYEALKNVKRIDYSTSKFTENELMIRIKDEKIENSQNDKIETGEIYQILTKRGNGVKD